jgi:hypothetical protein
LENIDRENSKKSGYCERKRKMFEEKGKIESESQDICKR